LNVRDWLHVEDHCRAIDVLLGVGTNGETYNIGGGNEVTNLDLTQRILALLQLPTTMIRPVADRLGHDRRYALDTTKLRSLGWWPQHVSFNTALEETVDWYVREQWWWRPLITTKKATA
jgi:dTDP-glucose 4,6-dehydratase